MQRLSCLYTALVLLLGSLAAPAAYADNYDGTLDASLAPPIGGIPYWAGTPGLFAFAWDLGGPSPYTNADTATAVLSQPDGKIVVAGYSWNAYQAISKAGNAATSVGQNACTLARYNADGTGDAGFQGGMVWRNFADGWPNNTDCYIAALALQGDGKIVAAGTLWDATHGPRGLVMRFNPDGSPDAAFNNSAPANPGWVLAGNNSSFNAVRVLEDGSIFTAGSAWYPGHSDNDFFWEIWAGNSGNAMHWNWAAFNLGGDNNDAVTAIVPDHIPMICNGHTCTMPIDQLYLVGTASMAPYASSNAHHQCAMARLSMGFGDTTYVLDTNFGANGRVTFEFGIPADEPDSICRTATRRYAGHGVTVGGELIFTSTLGGGTPGRASNFILADVDQAANVMSPGSILPQFQMLPFPGIYNSINAMARAPDGKLIVAGYGGTNVAGHGASDGGVIRFNQDYSFDGNFGNDGLGRAIITLDGVMPSGTSSRAEWLSAVALDNQGRITLAGDGRPTYNNDSDWLVGRLKVWDGLFRDGFDGVVPEWKPINQ